MYYEVQKGQPIPYNPMYTCVVPRPIGWISTIDSRGAANIAPYSFFNSVSVDPPMIMFCPCGFHKDGGAKDSAVNAEETGEFVYNMANWDMRDAMNLSSASLARNEDEFEHAGLIKASSNIVKAPRLEQSPVSFECKTWKIIDLPPAKNQSRNIIVIGEVVGVHIQDKYVVNGRIDVELMKPIARLGYKDYCVVENTFSIERPD
jgi:flavin reductase (DIM6/NTAB) family NADH-FMN oxidoreductase RutF